MKILLVNPYIYDFTAYDLWLRPMGLLYISSVIRKYTDCEIYWMDLLDRFAYDKKPKSKKDGRGKYNKEIVEKPEIYEKIPRNYSRYGIDSELFKKKLNDLPDMDIILFTTLMTYWIDGLNYTVTKIKKRFPDAFYILGGIIPTLIGENFAGYMEFNKIIYGYGEEKILKHLKMLGCKIKDHPDLSILENIPYPDFDILGTKKYLPLMTSRGCPFRCSYCASHLLNKKFLQRDADDIYDEIEYMVDKFDTKHFIIFDDAFLINKEKRFFKVFSKVKKNFNISFHTPNGLHTAEIDQKTASILFDSGFRTIRLSFESTSGELLKKSSNKVSVKDMISAVEELTRAGFKKSDIECYLLFGLPRQDLGEMESSINFVKDLGIKPRLSFFSPVPGTIEFQRIKKLGIIDSELNLYQTNKLYFLYEKSGFSINEINHIKGLVQKISESQDKKMSQ